jgi:hypothetical protein
MAASYLLAKHLTRVFGAEQSHQLIMMLTLTAVSVPVLVVVSSWPFVDTSTLAFVLGSIVYLVDQECRNAQRTGLIVGILSGGAIGTKLTALIPGFFNGLMITALCFKDNHWKPWLGFTLAIILVPSPWLIKSTVYHGNPVYPAGYGVFGGEEWDEETDAFYKNKTKEKGEDVTPINAVLSPLDVTIRWQAVRTEQTGDGVVHRLFKRQSPGYEEQNPGPALLVLLPFAIGGFIMLLRRKKWELGSILFLHLFGGWFFWLMTYQSVRFLMPQLILGILLGGAVLLWITPKSMRGLTASLFAILIAGQLAWSGVYTIWMGRGNPVAGGLGFREKETVLAEQFPPYTAFQWLELELQPDEKVFFLGLYKGFYAEFPVVSSDWFDRPLVLEAIRGTETNEELINQWLENDIRYVLYDRAELSLYLGYFKSRFTDQQWERFVALDETLQNQQAIAFQPTSGIVVIDLQRIQ